MAERTLIVNADGFGFGPGATKGILEAIANGGIITSVSVNANFPDAERGRELVAAHPAISVGVHVNPVAGSPCLAPDRVPSLVGRDGQFSEASSRRDGKEAKSRPRSSRRSSTLRSNGSASGRGTG